MLSERSISGPGRGRERMVEFLRRNGLGYEEDITYSYCLMEGDRVVAAGSLSGPVLKCIAVDPEYRALGLSAQVVSALCQEAARQGHTHLFLFTKPENLPLFQGLGFFLVASCQGAALLENRREGFKGYLAGLAAYRKKGRSGGVVLNANPFTLGHRYLVEWAAGQVDALHLFLVGEDRSEIPAADRETLVRQGVADLANVTVHPGTPYIISAATFPTYFLKAQGEAARVYAHLDLTIFGQGVAPALGLAYRFAGEEPLSPSTALYNQAMLDVLPPLGVEVRILPRLEQGGQPVSASRVRQLWRQGDWKGIEALTPPSTSAYLKTHPWAEAGASAAAKLEGQ